MLLFRTRCLPPRTPPTSTWTTTTSACPTRSLQVTTPPLPAFTFPLLDSPIFSLFYRQSYEEFRTYAEQQYPDNPDQQAILIRQLQEQHYYQYMQQVLTFPHTSMAKKMLAVPTIVNPHHRLTAQRQDQRLSGTRRI